MCFYEKVIKVKADLAALLFSFFETALTLWWWHGALSRAARRAVHHDP
jgi:hypothetical protein